MNWISEHLLSFLVFSPLLGILVVLFVPSTSKKVHRWVAIGTALIPFLCTWIATNRFLTDQVGIQLVEKLKWFHIHLPYKVSWIFYYHLGLDGFSLVFLQLATLLVWIATIASKNVKHRTKEFYLLLLLIEIGVSGVFVAQNLLLFFLFFEITFVTLFLLIGIWGQINREKAAFQFLIYNGIGSALLLYSLVILLLLFGTLEYKGIAETISASTLPFSSYGVSLLYSGFVTMFLAFAIKLPVFPFHSWMIRVHKEAPTSVVIIHAGVLLKIGAYGMIRFGFEWFSDYISEISSLLLVFGLINLFYGAILAYVQQELRSVLAYSSISHMGIILLGIGANTEAGLQGAILQSISHGLLSALLFFLVGSLVERTNTTVLSDLGGLAKRMPIFSGLLLIAGLGLLGLPGLSGFISEFFALMGVFQAKPVLAAVASLGLIFTAAYTLRAVMKVTYGRSAEKNQQLRDLKLSESLPMFILVLAIIWIGIVPDTLLEPLQKSVDAFVLTMGGK